MTWNQELRELGVEQIAQQLGGKKSDGQWWRLPYLCKGELKIKDDGQSGFKIISKNGWINAYCHHCELPNKELLRMVYDAIFGRTAKSNLSIKTAQDLSDEVVNGWPMLPEGVKTSYDAWLKDAIALHGKVQFTCRYHSANGDLLESVREEPGKRIWGKGSNSQLNPLPLLWPAGDYYNGMVVIAEGEKAAAALRSHGYNAISWRGGKSAWKHTRWEHKDSPWHWFQTIVFWPDNDDGSHDAFYQLGLHLPKEGSRDFLIVELPADLTDKRSADAADFTEDEVFVLLQNHTRRFSEWASEYVPANKPKTDLDDYEEPEEVPEIYKSGGYYDVLRMLKYLADDLAYIQAPADRGLTESLAIADQVGYWHLLHEDRNRDRLSAAIGDARVEASLEWVKEKEHWKPATFSKVMKFLERMPTLREMQEANAQLTTHLRQNEQYNDNKFKPLPQYNLENRRIAAQDGLLTFKHQVIALPSQSVLRKADVRKYGLVFDAGWSDLEWQAGDYDANTPQAEAVRTLLNNLGDFPMIVAEMLAGMDRRIAILHSKTSGVGKSMFTALLKTSLGSLVETAQPSELTKSKMSSQFPNLNNNLTRCRVLVIPEVNTVGLENVNFGKLVHLTGETHLTTERKYMEQVTLPRLGNVLLTMGEVQKKDAKGNPLIQWDKIQGLFDENAGDGRLRVWDIDVAGGQRISPRHFNEALTHKGQLALVDWLVQSMGSGVPDSRTPTVLDHINILFNTSRETPSQTEHYSPQLDKADAVIRRMTEWTDFWDHQHDVCNLARDIEKKLESEPWQDSPARMTDQSWLSSIRRVYDLPSMRNLEVEGKRNERTYDRNGRRNWPVRGFRFKEADEYGDE